MKKLMMILMMFVAVGVSGQNVVNNRTQYNLDQFVGDCLKELKIDSISLDIIPYKGLIYGQYKAMAYKGLLNYMISISNEISSEYEAKKTIRHELKHISQLFNNELIQIDNKTVIFKGIKYRTTSIYHYEDKWEVEARIFADLY